MNPANEADLVAAVSGIAWALEVIAGSVMPCGDTVTIPHGANPGTYRCTLVRHHNAMHHAGPSGVAW